ncbi:MULTISPECIES: hypothetical protein [Moorena]|uniref:Uncharacterized protein n=1 Tax=Moorena producens 3L TaxID=489825 RepID=F4XYI6_9CYAN|nr:MULTISPECIES: hypothetical protein [Moorena]NEP32483.1 hypothetical protein [Moorena sp. SIO3B2]NEQ16944.1 hypothetical protein [Moorena sp. SIO3E2]EGJ30399.1 hypothetical protein LYNGBM3L_51850 [Moorena producens 3L]NEP68088.1 hypothetical protein [Moorena sp. SIO3A5]NER89988.1 hypothetical protein [Moorena sp. SIO3A2]
MPATDGKRGQRMLQGNVKDGVRGERDYRCQQASMGFALFVDLMPNAFRCVTQSR